MSTKHAALVAALMLVRFAAPTGSLTAQHDSHAVPAPRSADSVIWTYSANDKISFLDITPLGSLAVVTTNALVVLEPSTGTPLWTRDDMRGIREGEFESVPLTPYGIVRSKEGFTVLDLQTGRTLWSSTTLGLRKVSGYVNVVEHNLMLVYGESDRSKHTLDAVDLQTGEVRWVQHGLFNAKPEGTEIQGGHALSGHQPPLLDTDSTMILYFTEDGPTRIHVRTGERLWQASALKGKHVPTLSRWYAPLLLVDGILLVPYEQKLMALEAQSGERVWEREKKLKSPIVQMIVAPQGFVVRGARPLDQEQKPLGMPDAFIDLIDLKTGASLWPKPFEDMKDESVAPALVWDDAVYFGDSETFYRINLADGVSRTLLTYKFEGGEEPAWLERRSDGFLLMAEHNLMILGEDDAPRQRVYYPAPGSSFLSNVGKGLLFVAAAASQASAAETQQRGGVSVSFDYNPFIKQRLEQTVAWGQFSYIDTRKPDHAGREGFSLVRVRRSDLQEAGRLWMDERSPDFLVDVVTGIVFLRRGDRAIQAHSFAAGEGQ